MIQHDDNAEGLSLHPERLERLARWQRRRRLLLIAGAVALAPAALLAVVLNGSRMFGARTTAEPTTALAPMPRIDPDAGPGARPGADRPPADAGPKPDLHPTPAAALRQEPPLIEGPEQRPEPEAKAGPVAGPAEDEPAPAPKPAPRPAAATAAKGTRPGPASMPKPKPAGPDPEAVLAGHGLSIVKGALVLDDERDFLAKAQAFFKARGDFWKVEGMLSDVVIKAAMIKAIRNNVPFLALEVQAIHNQLWGIGRPRNPVQRDMQNQLRQQRVQTEAERINELAYATALEQNQPNQAQRQELQAEFDRRKGDFEQSHYELKSAAGDITAKYADVRKDPEVKRALEALHDRKTLTRAAFGSKLYFSALRRLKEHEQEFAEPAAQ
ncbi:MAG TPA: hypothetical protein VG406_01350 [Isosphaeraceae bacterium]|nr:hypothetical protein [Isosphaeraceae bacterium]